MTVICAMGQDTKITEIIETTGITGTEMGGIVTIIGKSIFPGFNDAYTFRLSIQLMSFFKVSQFFYIIYKIFNPNLIFNCS